MEVCRGTRLRGFAQQAHLSLDARGRASNSHGHLRRHIRVYIVSAITATYAFKKHIDSWIEI